MSVRKCSRYFTGTHQSGQRLSQTGVSENAPFSESTIDTVQQGRPPGIDAYDPWACFACKQLLSTGVYICIVLSERAHSHANKKLYKPLAVADSCGGCRHLKGVNAPYSLQAQLRANAGQCELPGSGTTELTARLVRDG